MAQAKSFSVIGVSNILQKSTSVNFRACPQLSKAKLLSCSRLSLLPESPAQVSSEVCIVSCITNFIVRAGDGASVTLRVEPILRDLKRYLTESCTASPDQIFMIYPPMYRSLPLWYSNGLP